MPCLATSSCNRSRSDLIQDISKTSINGLESVPFIDKVGGAKKAAASKSPINISAEVDRVYTSDPENDIVIAENNKAKYEIKREELSDVVVWNPWEGKAGGMSDFGPSDGWKRMVCVETGSVSGWNTLEAGDSWEGGQRIRLC